MTALRKANFAARQVKRTKVLMRGVLVTARGIESITIRDISRQGAGVSVRDQISGEGDVLFRLKSLHAAGAIAWSKDRQAGLRFYRELTSDEFRAMLRPFRNARRALA